jgi:adenosine deaminase
MAEIVEIVGRASEQHDYPIVTKQILCMHSKLPYEVNRAIVELAGQYPDYVCAVDVAGATPSTAIASMSLPSSTNGLETWV